MHLAAEAWVLLSGSHSSYLKPKRGFPAHPRRKLFFSGMRHPDNLEKVELLR